jgi:putative membrane protein
MKIKMKKMCSLAMVALMTTSSVSFAADNIIKKDETVYVNLSANGEIEKIIVSDQIHSELEDQKIIDSSFLTDIKNVKGDEQPSVDGENLVWEIEGKDLFYQGNTDKEIPLEMKVTYYLDGQEIEPSELAGKSGKVKIELETINKEKHQTVINGETKDLYTPFMVASMVILPDDIFSNIKVNTGKVMTEGNNQIITYVSVPGLSEMISQEDETDIDITEKLVIEADAEEFELGPIMSIATCEIPEINEVADLGNMSKMIDSASELESASRKLRDGTKTLSDGQTKLADNLVKFRAGVVELGKGSTALIDGVGQLKVGIDSAYEGATKVANGIKQFANSTGEFGKGANAFGAGAMSFGEKAGEFANGATKLSEGLGKLTSSTKELETGAKTLTSGTDKLVAGEKQITAGVSASLKGVQSLIAAVGQQDPKSPMLKSLKEIEAGLKAVEAGSNNMTNELNNFKKGQQKLTAGLGELAKGTGTIKETAGLLQAGSKGLADGANKLAQSAAQLDGGAKKMAEGSQALVVGSQKVSEGLGKLSQGSNALVAGKTKLEAGSKGLTSAADQLVVGGNKLKDGAKKLNVNMNKFHQEGIQELSKVLTEKTDSLDDLLVVKDELVKLSEEYNSFSGIGKDMEGSVKFIMKTEEIKKAKEVVVSTEDESEEKKGFINWIKGLFGK